MTEKLKRIVEFTPAFDKRHSDPDKDYGIGCSTLRMVLKGPSGATQFVLMTGWFPEAAIEEQKGTPAYEVLTRPIPENLGYHSPVPMHRGQPKTDSCDLLEQGYCYYDGSALGAEKVFKALLEEGDEGVWKILEEEYESVFGAQETEEID